MLVVCSNQINGTEKIVLLLAENINKDKFNVVVALPAEGLLSEALSKKKIQFYIYNNNQLNTFSFKGVLNLFSYIKKNKPDVIHSHCSFIPAVLGKLNGIKLNIETRHGVHFSEEGIKNLPFLTKLKEKSKAWFEDLITTVAENDKLILEKNFNYPPNKMLVIKNGYNENLLKVYRNTKQKESVKEKKLTIGTVGRLVKEKNQEFMIKNFSELIKLYPNLLLHIIGSGTEKLNLTELISKLNLKDKIIIEEYSQDVLEKMSKFDIFILTSLYEGIPLVILDSLALGIPVVASDVGSISNIITENYNGFLFNLGKNNDFRNKIKILIENKNIRENMSFNAIESVTNLTIEKMVENYENMYLNHLKM